VLSDRAETRAQVDDELARPDVRSDDEAAGFTTTELMEAPLRRSRGHGASSRRRSCRTSWRCASPAATEFRTTRRRLVCERSRMAIVPDTKDWTWVIEQRCPECGFDSRSFPRESIGAMVRANAASWAQVLARPDAAVPPDAATWSALEYACHVRDVFRIYDERLRLMLTQDDPLFANWDQDATAIADRYAAQDPREVARHLAEAAEAVASRFDTVTGAQWRRPGRRSDGSAFTVESFARYFAHDWIHHLWDVTPG
jgi:hypothetical protein